MNASNDKQTLHTLERLLALCTDGAEGYRHAAAAIEDPAAQRVLAQSSAEREEIAAVLTYALVARGCKPDHQGSVEGRLHRRWLDAIAALSPNATRAIIHECQRGEQETMVAFTAALGQALPTDVHTVVQSQLGRVLHATAALNHLAVEFDRGATS